MKKSILLAFLSLATLLISCDNLKPDIIGNRATGNSGDLTVVMSNDLWTTNTGKIFRKKFGQWEPGLGGMMAEKQWKINKVSPKDLNSLYKSNRNVLYAHLDGSLTADTAVVELRENLYANQQLYVQIRAKNSKVLANYFKKNGKKLRRKFEESELKRIIQTYKTHNSPATEKKIQDAFHIKMTIDKGYSVESFEDNFMIVQRNDRFKSMELNTGGSEKMHILEGLMIWQSPYYDKIQINKDYIHRERDTTLKYHVRFPRYDNAYLGTEYDSICYPVQKVISLNGIYAVESRGIYRAFNHVMGGPFIQVTFVHPKTQQLINVMGYVHAPNIDKMELMRHLQAMLHDIECVKPSVEKEKPAAS